jgi:hypothetical protein
MKGGIAMLKTICWIGVAIIISFFVWGSSFAYDDSYGVKHRVVDHPYLDVKVWVDKGEGATYHPGDDIKVYFRTSRDCYVVIYDIDTRGYVSLLYPTEGEDDSYVEGGRVYRIPDNFDEYDLTIDGPNGIEYITAVASLEPIDYPNFPGANSEDEEVYAYKLDGEDPFEFMQDINREITSYDYASDVCIFNVEYQHPQWYYWPQVVYVDRPGDLVCGGAYFDYPWGVEVWIDGVFYGMTPILIPSLVVGRHYCSFWYHGGWIWRDWFHVRHDYNIRVRSDCWDRYRYVDERFVEKSYRAEKAKRRRGVEEAGGLVKPVRPFERERIAGNEVSRLERNKEFRGDESIKRRGTEDNLKQSQLSDDSKSKRTDREIERGVIRRSPTTDRTTATQERGIREKEVRIERKETRGMKRERDVSSSKEKPIATSTIKRNETPKPQPKAERIKTSEQQPKRAEPTSIQNKPVRSGNTSAGKESRGSKPEGRRR